MIAMVTLWGTWHGLAQVYGFGRIYDAKVGAFDPRTARLDKALCVAWFVLPPMVSPWRFFGLLEDVYSSGLPIVSPANLAALQTGWWAAAWIASLCSNLRAVARAKVIATTSPSRSRTSIQTAKKLSRVTGSSTIARGFAVFRTTASSRTD